jgi:hypothetical protein
VITQRNIDVGSLITAIGDDDGRVRSANGLKYQRLVPLKNKYDPTNQ